VIGGVSDGAMVLSPARIDLAEGTSVRVDLLPDAVASRARPSDLAAASLGDSRSSTDTDTARRTSGTPIREARGTDRLTEEVDQAISAALSARVLSIVNDARRNDPKSK
jgi:hypothetical protein